jgi:hypothetical protein
MHHGCGAICGAIANQLDAELLRPRDAIKQIEFAPRPTWQDIFLESRALIFGAAREVTLIVAIGLLCATVALCFGLACFRLLKLHATEPA